METKTKTIERNSNGALKNKTSPKKLLSRALNSNSEWPDKEEFLDVIYWSRQILGIIFGAAWGIFPVKGFLGLALFAAISCGLVYLYAVNFQSVDEEQYGGAWEIIKEGFMTSFAGFVVTWIIFYTGLYSDEFDKNDF